MTTTSELESEIRDALVADKTVHDDTETDDVAGEVVKSVRYRITSYGIDFDVAGLVRRLDQGSVFVPPFQREFVWSRKRASQFVESLLLGLPVPGVFLTQESDTEKMMVIDGQQRLKTLQFFYDGFFQGQQCRRQLPAIRIGGCGPGISAQAIR